MIRMHFKNYKYDGDLTPARKIPVAIRKQVKKELKNRKLLAFLNHRNTP